MATYTDDFNRADPIGSNWASYQGSPGLSITSNKVRAGVSGWCYGGWVGGAVSADHYSELLIAAADAADAGDIGVTVRTGAAVCYGFLGSNSKSYLGRWAGSTRTPLNTYATKFNVGDVVRLEIQGRWLRAFVNGWEMADASMPMYITTLASGVPGIGGYGVGTIDLGDDWAGGDLPTFPTILVPVSDNFTRANSPICSASSGINSGNWFSLRYGAGLGIVSNKATVLSTASGWVGSLWRGTFPNNQYAKITIGAIDPANIRTIGPVVRAAFSNASADCSGYIMECTASGGTTIGIINSGTGKTLLSTTATTWAAGDVAELRAEGNVLTGYKNGVAVISATDSALSAGVAGWISWATGAYTTTPSLSNWEGGPMMDSQPMMFVTT